MTRLERWCVGVLVAASSCAGSCRQDPPQIPLVLRPDTRRIQAFDMDSELVRQAITVFEAALPNEAALSLPSRRVRHTVAVGMNL